MARNKSIEQFDRCSLLLLRFLNNEILNLEVTNLFNSKVSYILKKKRISNLRSLMQYDGVTIRRYFDNSNDFRSIPTKLTSICQKNIPNEYKIYQHGFKYILITAFDLLSSIVKKYRNRKIDYHYINYSNVEKVFKLHNLATYGDLYNLGIDGVSNLPNFNKRGYEELVILLKGVKNEIETGKVKHTKKWTQIEKKKTSKNSKRKPVKKGSKNVKNKKSSKAFSLYQLSSGKPGKKFTIKEFLAIAKEAKKNPGKAKTDKTIKLDDGYVYKADSKQEISILKKMIANDSFKRLRGQCPGIPYKYKKSAHTYYPDFFILTQTNKIIVMEVKEVAQMNAKLNIRKYDALRHYCNKNGFLYLMCDKNFKVFERLSKLNSKRSVKESIDHAIKCKGKFDYKDYKELVAGQNEYKVKAIRDSIGIYVKSHKNIKMIGDLTHQIVKFKIIKKKIAKSKG